MASTLTNQVPEALDGQRLDKALATLLDVSRSVARDLVERGVEIDGIVGKPNTTVHTGNLLVSRTPRTAPNLKPEPVAFDLLYEDELLLVVNKPAGVVVHPGAGQITGTLAAGLLYRFPELDGVGAPGRWGLIHRLDKDTSGVMAVARTTDSYQKLSAAMKARDVRREYVTLVNGVLRPPTGTIEAAIGRDPGVPTRRAVTNEGKHAVTHYQVIANYEDENLALVSVQLETGRTHQIRVHFLAIGHPVVGDPTYNLAPARIDVPRIFLHAGSLTLRHPRSGEELTIEAPLPPDLAAVVTRLEVRGTD